MPGLKQMPQMPPMAPDFSQQVLNTGNQMLQQQGMAPYQPLQSPFFSNQAVQNHPGLTGALGGAMSVLANMSTPTGPTGVGTGISNLANGLMGGMMMNRQFHQQQAMLPMQLAGQVMEYRKSMAPQAIETKYGMVSRDPITGDVKPLMSPSEIAAGPQNSFNGVNPPDKGADLLRSTAASEADPDVKRLLSGGADMIGQIYDPQEKAKHVDSILGEAAKLREAKNQHAQLNQFSQQRIDQGNTRISMEQQRLGLMQQRFKMNEQQMRVAGMKMMYDYGINGFTGETLSSGNAPTGMLTDNAGNVIPNKLSPNVRPTTAARGKAEQADVIQIAGDTLQSHIAQVQDQIGPVMGRYNSLADFVGNPPPEYKGLASELQSWIALHPAAHGFRGVKAVEEFQKTFGSTFNTPESLIAGIRGAYNTMDALRTVGTPRTVQRPTSNANPNPMLPPGAGSNDPYAQYLRKGN